MHGWEKLGHKIHVGCSRARQSAENRRPISNERDKVRGDARTQKERVLGNILKTDEHNTILTLTAATRREQEPTDVHVDQFDKPSAVSKANYRQPFAKAAKFGGTRGNYYML